LGLQSDKAVLRILQDDGGFCNYKAAGFIKFKTVGFGVFLFTDDGDLKQQFGTWNLVPVGVGIIPVVVWLAGYF
jgi:hypothetical protein